MNGVFSFDPQARKRVCKLALRKSMRKAWCHIRVLNYKTYTTALIYTCKYMRTSETSGRATERLGSRAAAQPSGWATACPAAGAAERTDGCEQ